MCNLLVLKEEMKNTHLLVPDPIYHLFMRQKGDGYGNFSENRAFQVMGFLDGDL